MAPKFDDRDKQKIDPQGHLRAQRAQSSTPRKDVLDSGLRLQSEPGRYAAAWGTAKWNHGESSKWECPMEMAQGSKPFKTGPAKAWALARVTEKAGSSSAGAPISLEVE